MSGKSFFFVLFFLHNYFFFSFLFPQLIQKILIVRHQRKLKNLFLKK